MSKYSEEIKKQAEELIDKHYMIIAGDWCKHQDDEPIVKINAIESAIVSCEFALEYELSFDPAWKGVRLIKAYLESLL